MLPPAELPPADLTPAEVMRGAALYIERRGWHQTNLYATSTKPFPPACAIGGIHVAITGHTRMIHGTFIHSPAAMDLCDRVVAEFGAYLVVENLAEDAYAAAIGVPMPCAVVGDWNDEPERTAAEVIQTLRDAADEWDRTHDRTATAGGA